MWSVLMLMVVGVVIGSDDLFSRGNDSSAATASQNISTLAVQAGPDQNTTQPLDGRAVLEILAPIILEVSESGTPMGTTKEAKLLLRPGEHVLTLSNRELAYMSTHKVKIAPGEVRTIRLDPRGFATLRAMPWAEVWMKGEKVGETPLALQLPLGAHELVFKHPRFSERRVMTTIRANQANVVSVNMTTK